MLKILVSKLQVHFLHQQGHVLEVCWSVFPEKMLTVKLGLNFHKTVVAK